MKAFTLEPAHNNVTRHVTTGILSAGVIQGVKILCQFGSVIILSRLLPPSDFGIVAMVGPVFGFITLFQNLGLSQATVQKPNLTHDEVNAFFWINAGMGALLSVVLMVMSPLVGWYYGDHRVVALTIAMGGLVLVGGLGNQHGAILQRRMQFKLSALLDVAATVSALGVSIMWALLFGGYWSLYAGMVAGTVIPTAGVWLTVRWRPSLPRHVLGLRDMLKFGTGLTISNLMWFLGGNMDNVLIGRAWGNQELGLYDRAYKLLLFPLQRFVWPLGGIMIPILSRLADDPDRYRRAALKVLGQLTLALWPGILWALILSDTLIPTLLGQQWIGSAVIFRPLALAALMQVINGAGSWLLISQGRAGDCARIAVFGTIITLASFVIGLPYGAVGVAMAYAASSFLNGPITWWYVTRKGPVTARNLISALVPQTISSGAATLALLGYRHIITGASPWLLLIGGVVLAYATTTLVMLLFPGGRETLRQTAMFVRRSFLQVAAKNKPEELNPTFTSRL